MSSEKIKKYIANEFSWDEPLALAVLERVLRISDECEAIQKMCEAGLTDEELRKISKLVQSGYFEIYTGLVIPMREKFPAIREYIDSWIAERERRGDDGRNSG